MDRETALNELLVQARRVHEVTKDIENYAHKITWETLRATQESTSWGEKRIAHYTSVLKALADDETKNSLVNLAGDLESMKDEMEGA